MHPKYANLPFFIAAESYGGHYAPVRADPRTLRPTVY